MDGENLYEAWERYKEYQRLCPHHNLDDLQVFRTFYHGVDGNSRLALDTAAGGAIMELEPDEGYAVIEKITKNYFMWGSERGNPRRRHERHEVKAVSTSDYDALRKDFENLSDEVLKLKHPDKEPSSSQGCDICEVYEHETNSCPLVQRDVHRQGYEDVNFVGGNQAFQPRNQYQSQGPTFLQRNQNQGQQYQVQTQAQRPYQQVETPPQIANEPSGVEAMLAKILAQQERASRDVQAKFKDMQTQFERLETHNKMLEHQITQQAESSTRSHGKLPAKPEQVQREHCNAVTLRSGKELEGEQPKKKKVYFDLGGQASAEIEELDEEAPIPQTQKERVVEKEKEELRP
ncbi:unnamed protein product [Rhodiola kirilowii]